MKPTLTINNSLSQITGLDPKTFNKLRQALSYATDSNAQFFGGWKQPARKFMIDMKGNYPSGLNYRVKAFLSAQGINPTILDLRVVPKPGAPVALKPGPTPYKAQTEAVNAAIKHGQGILSLPTGSGKSFVIALLAAHYGLKTLVIVPTLGLKAQLTKSLKDTLVSSSHITVENIDSGALKRLTGFEVLIIDESHHVAARTYRKLNTTMWKGIYYRFFLTATPFRNQTEETLMFEGIAGKIRYKLSYGEAVNSGFIVPVEAYVINLPKVPVEGVTWAQVYSELIVRNEHRNAQIALLMSSLKYSDVPTLCLVKEIAHGKEIARLTGVPFANGQDEDSKYYIQLFNSGKIKSLIGTTGVLGEGIDSKPAQFVIIAGLGKAKSSFMQAVGRVLRTYPGKESGKVVLFSDGSHKFTRRHYQEQVTILKEEYGIEAPTKLEIT